MELYPHQRIAFEKLRNGSVLCGGVGSGKTHTAMAYYVQNVCKGVLDRSEPMANPMDLVVITTAKKRDDLDWESVALDFGVFRDRENSYGGVSITVDSWNNIQKYLDRTNTFFIFDEQRLVGAGTWVKTFLKIVKVNQWILLSATPADTWIDYVPLFIAHGFYRNRSHFIEEHVVWTFHGKFRKIRGYFGVRHLEAYRDAILVEMPFERHTTRHLKAVPVQYDVELFNKVWKRRWNVYEDVPLIDVAEMHRIGRKVVNSDPDRLQKLVEILRDHPRLIVFYTFDYELEALRTLVENDHIWVPDKDYTELMPTGGWLPCKVAEWNGHKHQPVPDSERWLYLAQYQAAAEGWNCTTTDAIVFYSLTYSHKLFEQSQGRIDRLDTPYDDLWYFILISEAKIDQIIWRALSMKKNFHEGRNVKFAA